MGNSCSSFKLYLEKKVRRASYAIDATHVRFTNAGRRVDHEEHARGRRETQCAVAGQTLSLNEIEHGVIRTRWDEPRVHACVNCASRSCPDLLGQAYRGDLCGNQPVS